jgi:hypothetical protein
MRLVLKLPLPSHQGEQAPGCRPLGTQAGDPIDHFYPFLAGFLEEDVTPQLKYLRQPGPITVAPQGLTCREIALFDAPMADVHGPRSVLTVADGRERKDQRNIGVQPWLVLCDDHDIVPTCGHNRLRNVTLGQEGVHRDNATVQDQVL